MLQSFVAEDSSLAPVCGNKAEDRGAPQSFSVGHYKQP